MAQCRRADGWPVPRRSDRRLSAPRHGTARTAGQMQIRRFCVRQHTIVIAPEQVVRTPGRWV